MLIVLCNPCGEIVMPHAYLCTTTLSSTTVTSVNDIVARIKYQTARRCKSVSPSYDGRDNFDQLFFFFVADQQVVYFYRWPKSTHVKKIYTNQNSLFSFLVRISHKIYRSLVLIIQRCRVRFA